VATKSAGAAGLADRYATALFELAESEKLLDIVAADLEQVARLIDETDDFRRLIRSPVVSRDDQGKALAAVAEKAGLNDTTRRFFGVLARNRRLFVLPAIIAAFLELLSAGRGETSAEVVSAKPLSETQLTDVRAALKKAVGSDVAVQARVDPGLLGGLIVKVGSRMIDSSLNTKLQQLRLAMKGIG
jgi:F-type H+-transporting ATPase subunit delta